MWVRPSEFILKSLICQEKFPKCLGFMNTIPKSSHDQDPHMPSISKEKRKALGPGCVRDTSSPLQDGSVRVFDLQATCPCQAGDSSWLTSSSSWRSAYPHWPSSWWSFDAGATLELLKTYMWLKSHLPISRDFNHYLYMSLYLYAFDLSFSWCRISISTAGLSVPYAEDVTHTIATPQPYLITPLWGVLTSQIWYGTHNRKTKRSVLQSTLLPWDSAAGRRVPLLQLCRLSSFWRFDWKYTLHSGCKKPLERSALWVSK